MTSALGLLWASKPLEELVNQVCYTSVLLLLFSLLVMSTGTNDKTGAMTYMLKWTSPQSIKEYTLPITGWTYPSVDKD